MQTYEDKFVATLLDLLDYLSDIAVQLIEHKFSNMDPDDIELAITYIEEADKKELVEQFCNHHTFWDSAHKRDLDFLLVEFPKMYPEMDMSMITDPIDAYKRLKKKPGKYGKNEDNWPINQAIIDNIWAYIDAFISLSCKYMHFRMKPSKGGYKRRDRYKDIPVEEYIKEFNIDLTK